MCALLTRDPKSNDVKLSAMSFFTFLPIFIALLKGNSARCMRFAHNCAHYVRAIPKLTPSSRWQRPSPPSSRFSSCSYASSQVKVLAELAVRPSHAVARTAWARSQNRRCHFVINANHLLHADFHRAPALLAR